MVGRRHPKLLRGVRAVQYKEQYGFDAVAADGVGLGIYRRNVENFLLGGHIGGDVAYPLSQRLSVAAKGRMGFSQTSIKGKPSSLIEARFE